MKCNEIRVIPPPKPPTFPTMRANVSRLSRIALRFIRATVGLWLGAIMVLYRRSRAAGGTFFFTVTLRDRSSSLLVERAPLLTRTMRVVRARRPWRTLGLVILPDHLHAVWELPEGDADFSGRWRAIKSGFVRALAREGHPVARNAKGECDLWQRRFWEHTIRDASDLERHIAYLHFNPVKHGYVARVKDWRWSTFHRYVQQGVLGADWAGAAGDPDSIALHPGYV